MLVGEFIIGEYEKARVDINHTQAGQTVEISAYSEAGGPVPLIMSADLLPALGCLISQAQQAAKWESRKAATEDDMPY